MNNRIVKVSSSKAVSDLRKIEDSLRFITKYIEIHDRDNLRKNIKKICNDIDMLASIMHNEARLNSARSIPEIRQILKDSI